MSISFDDDVNIYKFRKLQKKIKIHHHWIIHTLIVRCYTYFII